MRKLWPTCFSILQFITKVKMTCIHESFLVFLKQTRQATRLSWKVSQVRSKRRLSGMWLTSVELNAKTMLTLNGIEYSNHLPNYLTTVFSRMKSLMQKHTAFSFNFSTNQSLRTFSSRLVSYSRRSGSIQVFSCNSFRTQSTHTWLAKTKLFRSRSVPKESAKFPSCPISTL